MVTDRLIELCSVRGCEASGIDMEEAMRQGVGGWIYALHPEMRSQAMRMQVMTASGRNVQNISLICSLQSALINRGIRMGLLKGAALMTSYYDDISQRPIGDLDIWVDHRDVYRAYDILRKMSDEKDQTPLFRTRLLAESIRTHLKPLTIGGQTVELHYNLYSPDSDRNITSSDMASHFVSKGQYLVPDEPLMLYHLTTHLVKSRRSLGARLGWIVDIAMLFEKWGGKSAGICQQAIELNQQARGEMLDIWRYVVSLTSQQTSSAICTALGISEAPLTSQQLQTLPDGFKHGWRARWRSARCLLRAACSIVAEAKGTKAKAKAIADMAHDFSLRYKH